MNCQWITGWFQGQWKPQLGLVLRLVHKQVDTFLGQCLLCKFVKQDVKSMLGNVGCHKSLVVEKHLWRSRANLSQKFKKWMQACSSVIFFLKGMNRRILFSYMNFMILILNNMIFFRPVLHGDKRVISAVVISRHFNSLITFIMYFKLSFHLSTYHLYIFKSHIKCNVIFACQIIWKLSNNTNFLIINKPFFEANITNHIVASSMDIGLEIF